MRWLAYADPYIIARTMRATQEVCAKCAMKADMKDLTRCPICFKLVCQKCQRSRGGKLFCSQYCAEFFFHYEEED